MDTYKISEITAFVPNYVLIPQQFVLIMRNWVFYYFDC